MCWFAFSDFFLCQHCVQVINLKKTIPFCVPRTSFLFTVVSKEVLIIVFYTSIVLKLKFLGSWQSNNHSLTNRHWDLFKKLYKLEAEKKIWWRTTLLSLVHFFFPFLFSKPPSCSCEHILTHCFLLCWSDIAEVGRGDSCTCVALGAPIISASLTPLRSAPLHSSSIPPLFQISLPLCLSTLFPKQHHTPLWNLLT